MPAAATPGTGVPARGRVCLLAALAVTSTAPPAAEILESEIDYRGGEYSVRVEALLDAPPAAVRAVLTDAARMHEISPAISASRQLADLGGNRSKRQMDIHTCVLFFCFDFVLTETVRVDAAGDMHTRVLPQESDFEAGESVGRVRPAPDGRSCLRYESRREPRFWIPPIIGPAILQSKLERETVESMRLIEQEAQRRMAAPEAGRGAAAADGARAGANAGG